MKNIFSKYITFTGRVSAKEYRRFALTSLLLPVIAFVLSLILSTSYASHKWLILVISCSSGILFIISWLSMITRRLHDLGLEFKVIDSLKLYLDMFLKESDGKENQYGPPPDDIKRPIDIKKQ